MRGKCFPISKLGRGQSCAPSDLQLRAIEMAEAERLGAPTRRIRETVGTLLSQLSLKRFAAQIELGPSGPIQVILLTENGGRLAED